MSMRFALSDGTTTLDLYWHSQVQTAYLFARDTWRPSVARRRHSTLGGYGAFEHVTEMPVVHICGNDAAEALENLDMLAQLLDQAERFYRGEKVNPVVAIWRPEGAARDYQALILGRMPGDQSDAIGVTPTFNSSLPGFMIENVQLRFRRRGLWIGEQGDDALTSTHVETAISSTGNSPAILTATWAEAAEWPSPLRIRIDEYDTASRGFLIVTNNADLILFEEAEDFGADGTPTADAGANASGGDVLRYTATTSVQTSNLPISGGFADTVRLAHAFAAVRQNQTGALWQMRIGIEQGTVTTHYTDWFEIDENGLDPQVIALGVLAANDDPLYAESLSEVFIEVKADVTDGSKQLDVDYITLVDARDQSVHIISTSEPAGASGIAPTIIDPHVLTGIIPIVYVEGVSINVPLNFTGDAYVELAGDTIALLWIGALPGANDWGTNDTQQFAAARRHAYVIPR